MTHRNFFEWWEQNNDSKPPFGTVRTSVWEGPPDQVVAVCLPEFILEQERGFQDGAFLWSSFDVTFSYMTPHVFTNGLEYRLVYDDKTDTVLASRNTWVIPAATEIVNGSTE